MTPKSEPKLNIIRCGDPDCHCRGVNAPDAQAQAAQPQQNPNQHPHDMRPETDDPNVDREGIGSPDATANGAHRPEADRGWRRAVPAFEPVSDDPPETTKSVSGRNGAAQPPAGDVADDYLLHTLWTKAVGTPGYVKAEWQELERRLREHPSPPEKGPTVRKLAALNRVIGLLDGASAEQIEAFEQVIQREPPERPSREQLYRAAELVGSDIGNLMFSANTMAGPEVRLLVNCNDTFAYATADCEEVPWDRVGEVAAALAQCDKHGDILWAQRQRGAPFIPPVQRMIDECPRCDREKGGEGGR